MLFSVFQMVLSEEIQSLMGVMIKMAEVIIDMMDMILPAVGQLRNYMVSIQDLNLPAEHEFDRVCCPYYCAAPYPFFFMCVFVFVLSVNQKYVE